MHVISLWNNSFNTFSIFFLRLDDFQSHARIDWRPGLQLSRQSQVTRTGADHLVKIFLVRFIDMARRLTKISDGMTENSKASLNIPLIYYLPIEKLFLTTCFDYWNIVSSLFFVLSLSFWTTTIDIIYLGIIKTPKNH